MAMPFRVVAVSVWAPAQTTRHSCPLDARCSSQIRLLRVEPPRAGWCDAFEVRRIRMAIHSRQAYGAPSRSEEHTSELQSPCNLVCRLLLEKKKKTTSVSSPDTHSCIA